MVTNFTVESNTITFNKSKYIGYTPLKTNMSPKKGLFQKGIHLPTIGYQGTCWFSGEYRLVGWWFFGDSNTELGVSELHKFSESLPLRPYTPCNLLDLLYTYIHIYILFMYVYECWYRDRFGTLWRVFYTMYLWQWAFLFHPLIVRRNKGVTSHLVSKATSDPHIRQIFRKAPEVWTRTGAQQKP